MVDKDVSTFDATVQTIRDAVAENCYGFDATYAARLRDASGGSKARRIGFAILTLETDMVTLNLECETRGRDGVGRQSETRVRLPVPGWKVVAAHVPIMPAGAP